MKAQQPSSSSTQTACYYPACLVAGASSEPAAFAGHFPIQAQTTAQMRPSGALDRPLVQGGPPQLAITRQLQRGRAPARAEPRCELQAPRVLILAPTAVQRTSSGARRVKHLAIPIPRTLSSAVPPSEGPDPAAENYVAAASCFAHFWCSPQAAVGPSPEQHLRSPLCTNGALSALDGRQDAVRASLGHLQELRMWVPTRGLILRAAQMLPQM